MEWTVYKLWNAEGNPTKDIITRCTHFFFHNVKNNPWSIFAEVRTTERSFMQLKIKWEFLIPETAMSGERKMEERDHNVRPSWNDFPPPSHLSCVTFPSWGGTWAMSLFCKSRVESKDIGSKLSTSIAWIYSSKRRKLHFYSSKGVSNGWNIVLSLGYSLLWPIRGDSA